MSTATLPKQRNGCKIGQAYFRIETLKDAVGLWERTRDGLNLGASESPSVTACVEGKLYRISYNGRCWAADTGVEVIP